MILKNSQRQEIKQEVRYWGFEKVDDPKLETLEEITVMEEQTTRASGAWGLSKRHRLSNESPRILKGTNKWRGGGGPELFFSLLHGGWDRRAARDGKKGRTQMVRTGSRTNGGEEGCSGKGRRGVFPTLVRREQKT